MATAQLFLQALQQRGKEIPNLISPHLGDSVPIGWSVASSVPASQPPAVPTAAPADAQKPNNLIAALPLGGRIKLDPWSDQLDMIKSKPVGAVAEREKMPFEITPFILYLTRETAGSSANIPGATSAAASNSDAGSQDSPANNPR